MGFYENIESDFASRTLRIIDQYAKHISKGPENYEVTLLVNCLLGLLVLSQQRQYDLIPDVPLDKLAEWKIQGSFIKAWGTVEKGKPAPQTMRELVRRLRNSVAHFHLEAEGTQTDIERLAFSDTNGFSATIPVDNLKTFVNKFTSTIAANKVAGDKENI